MKRLALIAAVALVLVSGAAAKAPPDGFRVCGATACKTIEGNDAELLAISMFYSSTTELSSAPASAPFYAVHWSASDGSDQVAYYVVPAAAIHMAGGGASPRVSPGWYALSTDAQLALGPLAKTLQPFAPATLVRVTVAGKTARDPGSYAVLWSVGKPVYEWPSAGWLRVRIFTDRSSPWQGSILVSRRGNLLRRDDTVFAVPARVAARVRARASLR